MKYLFGKYYLGIRYNLRRIIDFPYDKMLIHELHEKIVNFEPDIILFHPVDFSYFYFFLEMFKGKIPLLGWLGVHPDYINKLILKSYIEADCLLYYDPEYEKIFKNIGCRRTERLPFGIDIDNFNAVSPSPDKELENSIVFTGAVNEERLEYFRKIADLPFRIYSYNKEIVSEGGLSSNLRAEVYGSEMISIMKSSAIVLNIHRKLEISGGNYRLFEIPAAKACQLVDYKPGISEYFEIGKELMTFKDKDEFVKQSRILLHDKAMREEIGKAGYERVKREHTINIRVERLIEIINSL
ncbi:MAG: glycosyltransferase [Candidatus Coatesbacteria bacterium]|nr:glycosyltransferase [Candidatus Coatesbacteria bacterium]